MRNRALIAIAVVLCGSAAGCNHTDTETRKEWPPPVEPRWSVVPKRPAATHRDERCGSIHSHADAVAMLLAQPHCIDTAIAALEGFADSDPAAMSDLAAAYYIRAKDGRPSDLLKAFDAAEHAVAARPQPPGARHNRALALEALGLTTEAIAAWNELQKGDRSQWGDQARDHRDRLRRELGRDAVQQWSSERLADALRTGDEKAVARHIRPFPRSAQQYLEDTLLPQCTVEPTNLRQARLLATQLTRVTGDRYPLDAVDAIASALRQPETLRALQRGHAAFHDARAIAQVGNPNAQMFYQTAAEQLRRGRSPLFISAEAGLALASETPERFDLIEQEAHRRGYLNLAAWIESLRAYFLLYDEGRYVEALTKNEEALNSYIGLHDPESVAIIRTRQLGLLRVLGQTEASWREALEGCRHLWQLPAIRERNLLLGETAATALALGHPRPALLYANAIVRLIRKDLVATPPERTAEISRLQYNLSIALRRRASYELHNDQYDRAREDLNEAVRLISKDTAPDFRRSLEARIAEVEAQALTHIDARRAADAFTRALALSKDLEYISFRASLYVQRADTEKKAGNRAAAEQSLRAALEELHAEETNLLARRKPDESDKIPWGSYFSRFESTYHLLIRQLIEDGREQEAFAYADRARAFEPLNLALRLTASPKNIGVVDLPGVQKYLPRGTFLIEYTILDDRTYAWVISRDTWQLITLPVGKKTIDRWSAALQQAVHDRQLDIFETTLFAAYDKLLSAPMAAIARMPDGARPRLAVVPDGAMHGIPFPALHNPITRRYLMEDAPVEIAGSAALYAFSIDRDRVLERSSSVLLIGNPKFDHRLPSAQGMPDLPGAEEEVERIERLYAPHAVVLTGARATIAEFASLASNSAIVHVAAHGVVNPQIPSQSSLLLAPSQDSGELDAAHLLTRLKLGRTRLVVLAACSSAGGLPIGPEGVGPLVRPLVAGGVPAVIGSLWDVEDATSEALLVSFHRHYLEGNDAAVAMQLAQIDLLRNRNSGLQSVLVWAPFQVIGHGSSPFAASRQ